MALYLFSEESILWFSSYIIGRSQCVQVESKISDPLPLPWGVPQGSILGPLLFLLYINELAEAVKVESNIYNEDADVIVYADDNTPISADRDPDILEVKIKNVADLATDWFILKHLPIIITDYFIQQDRVLMQQELTFACHCLRANFSFRLQGFGTFYQIN